MRTFVLSCLTALALVLVPAASAQTASGSGIGRGELSTETRTIAPGEKVRGTIVVTGGDIVVRGELDGDAIALGGDVVLMPGGLVEGDAVSLGGRVRLEGGQVRGDVVGGPKQPRSAIPVARRMQHSAGVAFGWLVITLLIGFGVLVLAGSYLDGVTRVLERRFLHAFWMGVVGELALFPVMLLLVVGLALTIVGILVVPFAIVLYVFAAAGLLMLGFLGAARVTGLALLSRETASRLSARGAALRALVTGIVALLALWFVAAFATPWPWLEMAVRLVAAAICWVAVTAGFGAALISRAGTRRTEGTRPSPKAADPLAWQTPTPVTGVAAARRTASGGSRR